MGRWGMGMSACDEFGDVKDEFLSQVYYTDNTFEQIEKNILADYAEAYADFDTDYGVWHDVYFAIADCEWQYGYKSERIWAKVEEIIVNGLDLKYMEELCASPQDIKQREKVLNKFWHKIQTQKEKPTKRKRKKPFENHFKTGDVFAYKHEGIYHCGVVLQVIDKNPECKELYAKDYNYCIAIAELTTQTLPSTADIINAEIRYAEWAFPYNLPPKCPLVIIDNIKDRVSNDYRGYLGYMLAEDRVAYGGLELIGKYAQLSLPCWDKHMKKNKIDGKPIYYLFNTQNLLATEQVYAKDIAENKAMDEYVSTHSSWEGFEEFFEEWIIKHNLKF